jgi:hypothetical protein
MLRSAHPRRSRTVSAPAPSAGRVQPQIPDLEHGERITGPRQISPRSREQLRQMKRLGQIVIGATIKPADPAAQRGR